MVSSVEDSSSGALDQRASGEKPTGKRQRGAMNSRFHVLHSYNEKSTLLDKYKNKDTVYITSFYPHSTA